MRRFNRYILLMGLFTISQCVWAQNVIDHYFFRSTVSIDDPIISDKLILSDFRTEAPAEKGGNTWTTNPQLLYGKTITKDLLIAVTGSYLHIQPPGQNAENGFDNWAVGARYNLFNLPQAQSILSIALNATIGGSGSHVVNAASTTSISPQILFGQGLANVSDSIKYLKPLSLLIAISPEVMTTDYNVTSVNVGAAIEYNLSLFQQLANKLNYSFVEHLVPIVEFPFNICTEGACDGRATGTINPGLIAFNRYGQFGLEAIIPSNSNTGSKVGGVMQLHLYLDALFPNSIGKPIF